MASKEYHDEEDSSAPDASLLGHAPQKRPQSPTAEMLRRMLPWMAHLVLLAGSFTFFILGLNSRHLNPQDWPGNWHPMLGEHAPTRTVRFDGNFERDSPYKGPPSTEVDKLWDELLPSEYTYMITAALEAIGGMRVPEAVFQTLNASKYSVKVPEMVGGGRLGLFEGIHQIHCLKSLWMATYPKYYKEEHQFSLNHHEEWRNHIDHCTDILRQKLMCDADPMLLTFNWIKGHYAPHPNFHVQHQCRDYGRLLEAAKENHIDGSRFEKGYFLRPEDGDWVDFEAPPADPNADS